jgi:hypothetical protein
VQPANFGIAFEEAERFYRSELRAESFDEREELFFDKEDGGGGVVKNIAELVGGEANIQRQQDGASFEDAVVGLEEAVAIGTEEGNAIAGLDAEMPQGAAEARGAVGELRVVVAMLVADNGGARGILLLGVAQKPQGCERDIHVWQYAPA